MAAQSARQAGDRPFYAAYGWAYDLLITHPVRPWADMVSAALDSAGIAAPARMLDAGCGTGRHGAELARRGYRLDLVDASASLLGQARARLPHAPAHRADLCTLGPGTRYDAITTPPSRRPAPGGDTVLDQKVLDDLLERYDTATAFGRTHNRLRDWDTGNHLGYALGCWLEEYGQQVFLFTRNFAVS